MHVKIQYRLRTAVAASSEWAMPICHSRSPWGKSKTNKNGIATSLASGIVVALPAILTTSAGFLGRTPRSKMAHTSRCSKTGVGAFPSSPASNSRSCPCRNKTIVRSTGASMLFAIAEAVNSRQIYMAIVKLQYAGDMKLCIPLSHCHMPCNIGD